MGGADHTRPCMNVVLLYKRLQTILANHGIAAQTMKQVEPVEVRPPSDLTKVRINA